MAFKEIERLNLRVAELESQSRQQIEIITPANRIPPPVNPSSLPKLEILNELQVAEYRTLHLARAVAVSFGCERATTNQLASFVVFRFLVSPHQSEHVPNLARSRSR
jgi:hypothetical protein